MGCAWDRQIHFLDRELVLAGHDQFVDELRGMRTDDVRAENLTRKREQAIRFELDFRYDPSLKPVEFMLVVKGAERDVTQQYAVV